MNALDDLRCLLYREWLDQRENRMVWPLYLMLPLIGAALPCLAAWASGDLLKEVTSKPELSGLVSMMRWLALASGMEIERAAALMLVRISAAYFLLMPMALVSISGAYAIVGEKLQRSLEPLLATPIDTRTLLLGKLLAVWLPAVLASALSALLGALGCLAVFQWKFGWLLWPDAFYWIGVLVLGPQIGAFAGLLCIRISARQNDPQAANQITALVLMPALFLLLGLLGPLLISSWLALGFAIALAAAAIGGLLVWVQRGFHREEILVRWR